MKVIKKLNLPLIFLVLSYSVVKANLRPKPINSSIKKVTLFMNQAQLTNKARVSVAAGQHQLVFGGFPFDLDKQNIQVKARGNIVILSVEHKINYLKSTRKSLRIKQMEDSLEYLNEKIEYIEIENEVLEGDEKLILSNKAIAKQKKDLSIEKLAQLSAFYRKKLLEIRFSLLKRKKLIKKYNKTITRLQKQLTEENKNTNIPSSEVIVTVSAPNPILANFEITYLVKNAGWRPSYTLKSQNTYSPMLLGYNAEVYQNTGIDWKNVAITISTGNPPIHSFDPILPLWYVSFYKPLTPSPAIKNARNNNLRIPNNYNANSVLNQQQGKSFKTQTIANFTSQASDIGATKFTIRRPYTIPSSGRPYLINIKNNYLKTRYVYRAIPRLKKRAFVMAKLMDWEKHNLLPGKANIYYKGDFVAQTLLSPSNPNDTLMVALGIDKSITINKKQMKDSTYRKMLAINVNQTFGDKIIIRNKKNQRVNIQVKEQIPLPKDQGIDVKLLEADGAIFDKNTGYITWKITLKPWETKVLTIRYSVHYPKKKSITFTR